MYHAAGKKIYTLWYDYVYLATPMIFKWVLIIHICIICDQTCWYLNTHFVLNNSDLFGY